MVPEWLLFNSITFELLILLLVFSHELGEVRGKRAKSLFRPIDYNRLISVWFTAVGVNKASYFVDGSTFTLHFEMIRRRTV